MVESSRVGRSEVLRIHSTPETFYFSFLQTKMERSLPTDAVQRIKAKKSRVFILMLVNLLERWCALLQSGWVAEKMREHWSGNRTLVLALLTAVNCKEVPFKANQIVPIVRNDDASCMVMISTSCMVMITTCKSEYFRTLPCLCDCFF